MATNLRPGEERRKEVSERMGGKSSKQDVYYRPSPRGSTLLCSECEHYLVPNNPSSGCRKVAGIVYGDDTCDLYTARAGS